MIKSLQELVTRSEKAMDKSLSLTTEMNNSIDTSNAIMAKNQQSLDDIRDRVSQISGATQEQIYTVKDVESAAEYISVSAEQLFIDSRENCENCQALEEDARHMKEDVSRLRV